MTTQKPYTITMEVVGDNLRMAALEWRAAVYDKKQVDEEINRSIDLAASALQMRQRCRKIVFRSAIYCCAATVVTAIALVTSILK